MLEDALIQMGHSPERYQGPWTKAEYKEENTGGKYHETEHIVFRPLHKDILHLINSSFIESITFIKNYYKNIYRHQYENYF